MQHNSNGQVTFRDTPTPSPTTHRKSTGPLEYSCEPTSHASQLRAEFLGFGFVSLDAAQQHGSNERIGNEEATGPDSFSAERRHIALEKVSGSTLDQTNREQTI